MNCKQINSSTQTNSYLSNKTPRKMALRKRLYNLTKKHCRSVNRLHVLRKKYSDKIAKLYQTSIKNVEHLIAEIGKYLKGTSLNFVSHQLRMSQRHIKGRRYTEEIKLLSLSLYNCGPKAYAYLAEILALPSKTSLLKWLANMKSTTSFLPEKFAALAQRLKFMPIRNRVCALVIDEITLKNIYSMIVGQMLLLVLKT